MKDYTVYLKRDADGWWVASVRGVPGCHTQGRTIEQTLARVREALGLFVDDAESAVLKPVLPATVVRVVIRQEAARERAEREQRRARELLCRAVLKLTEDLGISFRDAGRLLGLSHQRVQQLRDEARARA